VKIYIVYGTTGEYSDRSDWIVCAYENKKFAEDHVSKAMHRAMEISKKRMSLFDLAGEKNEFDPGMKMDYTGTEYTVLETELCYEGV
jgi:hypothetical protein